MFECAFDFRRYVLSQLSTGTQQYLHSIADTENLDLPRQRSLDKGAFEVRPDRFHHIRFARGFTIMRRVDIEHAAGNQQPVSRQRLYAWRDHLRLHGYLKSRRRGRPARTVGVGGAAQQQSAVDVPAPQENALTKTRRRIREL